MKHIIVGTAGHIDHGKTALIKALTGTNTDRLKEEQQRGITIDIGFAFLNIGHDIELGIIDVPGHEKFVKNMLAGVGGIDLAILVIAADEGIMPQTEEHLAICDLLHIQRGLVAVTKSDLVDEEWLDMVLEDIREGVQGTFLQDAPIVPVSSKTDAGLDQLLHELEILAVQVKERNTEGLFRLPIDRVFTIKGFGTVVTGTLIAGTVQPEDVVEILPEHITTRIRNVHVHDHPVRHAYAGQRTALNLHGLEKRTIERGMVLSTPGFLNQTFMLDAHFTLLTNASKSLKHRQRVRFHHGTNEILARVILFDREELQPGESTYIQIRLEAPLVAMARDRFIIRSYSPIMTIGGGEILSIHPQKHKRSGDVLERLQTLQHGSLEEILSLYVHDARFQPITPQAISGMLALHEREISQSFQQLLQQGVIIQTGSQGMAVIHRSYYQQLQTTINDVLTDFHRQFPLKAGMMKEELRKKLPSSLPTHIFQQALEELMNTGTICVEQKLVRKGDHRIRLTSDQERAKQKLEQVYLSSRFQPPNASDAVKHTGLPEKEGQEMLRLLMDEGTFIRLEGDLYYHKDVLQDMIAKIVAYLKHHQEIAIGNVKDLFQISRKYSVPILAYLDAEGVTLRKGDVRILREHE